MPMRRRSLQLGLYNALTRPALSGRADPYRAFDKIYADLRSQHGFAITDGAVLDGLRELLIAYSLESGLSGVGWQIAQQHVTHHLDNRMRVQTLHARYPELTDIPVTKPIFVVGLPRTATTLTHKVLAAAQDARGPQLHEMFKVARHEDLTNRQIARRKRAVERQLGSFLKLSPDWDLIHPMRADDVEETTFLVDHSPMTLGTAPLESYWRYLTKTYNPVGDFELLKASLQVLAAGRPPTRWVLKHPGNLFYLKAILEVFPDATIVWTHRAPDTVFGSMCSMAESLHHLHLKRSAVDPKAIGRQWLKILTYGIETARRQKAAILSDPRSRVRPDAFIDLSYNTLMADPTTQVGNLFEKLGLPWRQREIDLLGQALRRPVDGRRHEYPLSRYGFDSDELYAAFGDYPNLLRHLDHASRLLGDDDADENAQHQRDRQCQRQHGAGGEVLECVRQPEAGQ